MENLRVLLVGHISIDRRDGIVTGGGPPRYQLPILLAHGVKNVDILTSTTQPHTFPNYDKINVINCSTEVDTVFSFKTNNAKGEDDRTLFLESKASTLVAEQLIPSSPYDLIIISGIVDEVSMELIRELREMYPHATIGLDAQTLARIVEVGKNTIIKPLHQKQLDQLGEHKVILRGSFVELYNVDDYTYSGLLIRTNRGDDIQLLVYGRKEEFTFTKQTEGIIDSTGSGDMFFASFLLTYHLSKDLHTPIQYAHHITKQFLSIQGIPKVDDVLTASTIAKKLTGFGQSENSVFEDRK